MEAVQAVLESAASSKKHAERVGLQVNAIKNVSK